MRWISKGLHSVFCLALFVEALAVEHSWIPEGADGVLLVPAILPNDSKLSHTRLLTVEHATSTPRRRPFHVLSRWKKSARAKQKKTARKRSFRVRSSKVKKGMWKSHKNKKQSSHGRRSLFGTMSSGWKRSATAQNALKSQPSLGRSRGHRGRIRFGRFRHNKSKKPPKDRGDRAGTHDMVEDRHHKHGTKHPARGADEGKHKRQHGLASWWKSKKKDKKKDKKKHKKRDKGVHDDSSEHDVVGDGYDTETSEDESESSDEGKHKRQHGLASWWHNKEKDKKKHKKRNKGVHDLTDPTGKGLDDEDQDPTIPQNKSSDPAPQSATIAERFLGGWIPHDHPPSPILSAPITPTDASSSRLGNFGTRTNGAYRKHRTREGNEEEGDTDIDDEETDSENDMREEGEHRDEDPNETKESSSGVVEHHVDERSAQPTIPHPPINSVTTSSLLLVPTAQLSHTPYAADAGTSADRDNLNLTNAAEAGAHVPRVVSAIMVLPPYYGGAGGAPPPLLSHVPPAGVKDASPSSEAGQV